MFIRRRNDALVAAVVVALAACADLAGPDASDRPLAPAEAKTASHVPPEESYGPFTVAVPPIEKGLHGDLPWQGAGAPPIPPGRWAIIRVTGTLSLEPNSPWYDPMCAVTLNCFGRTGESVYPTAVRWHPGSTPEPTTQNVSPWVFESSGDTNVGQYFYYNSRTTDVHVWTNRLGPPGGKLCYDWKCYPPAENTSAQSWTEEYRYSGGQSLQILLVTPISVSASTQNFQSAAPSDSVDFSMEIHHALRRIASNGTESSITWTWLEHDTLATTSNGANGGPVSVSTCTNKLTCRYRPARPGRMLVQTTLEKTWASGKTDVVWVNKPELVLTCNGVKAPGDVEVVRADDINCAATATHDATVEVLEWRFTDGAEFHVPAAGAQAVTATSWGGTMVRDGSVTVRARVGGIEQGKSISVTIRGREWSWNASHWTLSEGTGDHCQPATSPKNLPVIGVAWGWNHRSSSCEEGRVDPNLRTMPDAGYMVSSITSGPNTGLWYVATPDFRMDRASGILDAVKSGGVPLLIAAGTHSDCTEALQTSAVNFYTFNGVCQDIDVGSFHLRILDHEGFGTTGLNGHEAQARIAAADPQNDPRRSVEGWSAISEAELRMIVRAVIEGVDQAIARGSDPTHTVVKNNFSGTIWTWDVDASTFFSTQAEF